MGDGEFLWAASALWTACALQVPMLIVVGNNRSSSPTRFSRSWWRRSASRPPENRWIGQRIDDPHVDLAALARGQGLVGIGPVRRPRRGLPALNEAVAAVRAGKVCVVDVHVAAGDDLGAATGILQSALGAPLLPSNAGGEWKPAEYQPVKAEKQFQADEADDVPFQAQTALVVHEFDEGAGGLADQRELSLHSAAALHQLVFVLQSRIKPLELGMIPKNIGFFFDLYASDHAVLGQQHVADLPQQLFGLGARSALALQSHRERLDAVEDAGDARLRMPEDQALRQSHWR